jgi:hypothetical protein
MEYWNLQNKRETLSKKKKQKKKLKFLNTQGSPNTETYKKTEKVNNISQ